MRIRLACMFIALLWLMVPPPEAKAVGGCEVRSALFPIPNLTFMGVNLCDGNGGMWVSLATLIEGEDTANHVMNVRTVTVPSPETNVDAQIKASAGYVSHMICTGTDSAATAGTIILYDSLTETGTALYTHRVSALDNHNPVVLPIMANAATGIYLGFTTTADVYCTVFYK